jgi:hypothetical protein
LFFHAIYLSARNACVNSTVQDYLLGGPLPSHDLTCQASVIRYSADQTQGVAFA